MSIIQITDTNINYLNTFLQNDFPITFRYFNNKTAEQVIKNHYKTILYLDNNTPVGYAHIDYDIVNNKYWFGICVLSSYQKMGIGSQLIAKILEYFNNSDIDSLHLTVDKVNTSAYNLYLKNGFTLNRETNTIYIMSIYKSNILYLPVSFGEAVDKLTILDIKMNKITDSRRCDVEKEFTKLHNELLSIINKVGFYYDALKIINLSIWEDQDLFRYSSNDEEKNALCKKIIEDNDARFRIKNKINNIMNSFLKEQKGYNPKIININYTSTNMQLLNSLIKYHSIFNDKVIVNCIPEKYDYLISVFNSDPTIIILPSLVDGINQTDYEPIDNKLFEYIFDSFYPDN
jgi:GNAT superfamily N-acetyltransferase